MTFIFARDTYDDIGNLTTEQRGMTEMQFDYTSNLVNQYMQRLVPGIIPVTGQASADSTVSVWLKNHGQNAAAVVRPTRDGEYFKATIPVNNTGTNVTEALEITAVKFNTALDKDVVKTIDGSYTVPKTPQLFTYDDDGNMTGDGVWNYAWNGENRLVAAEQTAKTRLEFKYDYLGRRIEKKVYNWVSSTWSLVKTRRFVYDGWNLIAVYDENSALKKSYLWGEDISGSLQGAGGVGGLLVENSNSTSYYSAYDGNGNVCAYFDAAGTLAAEYSYGPFGNILTKNGPRADDFSFRFSSKYFDHETGLYYYGYRYYSPDLMRWLNRDLIGEKGSAGFNLLYGFVRNNPVNNYDVLGLWGNPLGGPNHEELTKESWKTLQWGKSSNWFIEMLEDEIIDESLEAIVESNVAVDSGSLANALQWHFNRPLDDDMKEDDRKKNIDNYISRYQANIVGGRVEFHKNLDMSTISVSKCEKAREIIGRLSHAWQDYYAHAIERGNDSLPWWMTITVIATPGVFWGGATPGTLTGSPEAVGSNMKPASWFDWYNTGEHGATEPGVRANDLTQRRSGAVSYVQGKFQLMMAQEWWQACHCTMIDEKLKEWE